MRSFSSDREDIFEVIKLDVGEEHTVKENEEFGKSRVRHLSLFLGRD